MLLPIYKYIYIYICTHIIIYRERYRYVLPAQEAANEGRGEQVGGLEVRGFQEYSQRVLFRYPSTRRTA